jgi:hypothetical protein
MRNKPPREWQTLNAVDYKNRATPRLGRIHQYTSQQTDDRPARMDRRNNKKRIPITLAKVKLEP